MTLQDAALKDWLSAAKSSNWVVKDTQAEQAAADILPDETAIRIRMI